MTYQELLPIYQASTGLPGQDDAFNQWVQGLVNASGSQQGVEGIPSGFVTMPGSQPGPGNTAAGVPNTAPSTPTNPTEYAPTNTNVGSGIGNLLDTGDLQSNATNALNAGVLRSGGSGNNTNQVQGGTQVGGYDSSGNQVQTSTNTQNTTGTQSQTGTNTTQGTVDTSNTQTGATTGTSTSVSGVNDTLGLGGLIQGQAAGAGQADATRLNELTKIATQGGAGLQSQMDQGIRNAISGPGMVGAGANANDRAAGYAAAQMGRTDLDARLGALQQLAAPTATSNLVAAGTPLLGRTENTTNSGTSSLSSVGSQIQDMVNSSSGSSTSDQSSSSTGRATDSTNQAGTAVGSNLSVATGQTPQQSQSSGGGCFVASALASLKLIGPRGIRKAVRYKLDKSKYMPIGYALYGPWLAKQVLKHSLMRRLMLPLVRGILYEELRLAGKAKRLQPTAWTTHLIFHYGSAALGYVASLFGAEFETKDSDLRNLLQQHNLYFS